MQPRENKGEKRNLQLPRIWKYEKSKERILKVEEKVGERRPEGNDGRILTCALAHILHSIHMVNKIEHKALGSVHERSTTKTILPTAQVLHKTLQKIDSYKP